MLGKVADILFGKPIETTVKAIADGIDQFVETPDERAAAELLKAKMAAAPHMAQVEINKLEAGHRSVFVAGWRPFIGWICGLAMVVYFLLGVPFAIITSHLAGEDVLALMTEGFDPLWHLLLALLGLGGLRTLEKFGGLTR